MKRILILAMSVLLLLSLVTGTLANGATVEEVESGGLRIYVPGKEPAGRNPVSAERSTAANNPIEVAGF